MLPENLTDEVRAELQKVKRLGPDDGLLICYSGHGKAQGDRFYLVTADAFAKEASDSKARNQRLLNQSISDVDIEAALENVQAGQMMMILDTCNSGAIEGEGAMDAANG